MAVASARRCAAVSDIGLRRTLNQDAYLMNADLGLFAVADGMGGPPGGDVASRLAVEALANYVVQRPSISAEESLRGGFRTARDAIQEETKRMPELNEMGTTLVAARIVGNRFSVANIGDSRAYLFRTGELLPLTEDHSLVNDRIRMGIMSKEDSRLDPRRNILTRALGRDASAEPDVTHADLTSGNLLLLCTDGLNGMINDVDIAEVLSRKEPLIDSCRRLVRAALDAGGDDNVTVILVEAAS